jgi:hypothetical protein
MVRAPAHIPHAAAVTNGRIGFNRGSQTINDTIRETLQDRYPGNPFLKDDSWWPRIAQEIEGRKRRFDATTSVSINIVTERVSIDM